MLRRLCSRMRTFYSRIPISIWISRTLWFLSHAQGSWFLASLSILYALLHHLSLGPFVMNGWRCIYGYDYGSQSLDMQIVIIEVEVAFKCHVMDPFLSLIPWSF